MLIYQEQIYEKLVKDRPRPPPARPENVQAPLDREYWNGHRQARRPRRTGPRSRHQVRHRGGRRQRARHRGRTVRAPARRAPLLR